MASIVHENLNLWNNILVHTFKPCIFKNIILEGRLFAGLYKNMNTIKPILLISAVIS